MLAELVRRSGGAEQSSSRARIASLLAFGCSMLIVLSFLVAAIDPEFTNVPLLYGCAAATVLLAGAAILRREHGPLAVVALIIAGSSVSLVIAGTLVGLLYSALMRIFMPN